jgi:hypothetical protein
MTVDCTTCQEWLDLEADGAPPAGPGAPRRGELAAHLESCADCRSEQQALTRTREALAASRVAVRSDFRDQVMAALPAAGWEARSPRAWRLPAALLLALAGAAAALAGFGSARLHPGLPFAGALAAVGDLFQTALLAGAGLLGASWRGVGGVVAELLGGSPGSLVALVVLVAGIDLLLLSLLRRRAAPAAERRNTPRGDG